MAVDMVMMIASARRIVAVIFMAVGFCMQLFSLIGSSLDSDIDTDMLFTGCAASAFGVFYYFI